MNKLDPPLDGTARARLAVVSKGLFASKYVFEAMLVIAEKDQFYATQIADAVNCQVNYAGKVIDRLAEAGLVEPVERDEGQIRHYYRRVPSPWWEFIVTWAPLLVEPPASSVAHLPTRANTRRPT
jgi:hypothetical protein